MKIYGFVFARGGSKGVPHKNIRPLCGKPLIAYAIEAGLASGCVEKMIVSTDNEAIAKVAQEYGAEVPFLRPAELAADNSPEWLAFCKNGGIILTRLFRCRVRFLSVRWRISSDASPYLEKENATS